VLEYHLIRSKRRTISIEIQPDGAVWVRAPLRMAQATISDFVTSKQAWIEKSQQKMAARSKKLATREFRSGETFLYQGAALPLHLTVRRTPPLELTSTGWLLSASALGRAEAAFEAWYRRRARTEFTNVLDVFSAKMRVQYQSLRISSARTRWGSCSTLGTISLNWRLLLAPPEILEYVAVHELAHLRQRNHSKAFWAEVAAFHPQYAASRRWLKENGASLRIR